jgi:hypothetical protein
VDVAACRRLQTENEITPKAIEVKMLGVWWLDDLFLSRIVNKKFGV